MKIKRIKFQNYTVFEDQQMEFSPGINVIIGENGTGKTHLMKWIENDIIGYISTYNISLCGTSSASGKHGESGFFKLCCELFCADCGFRNSYICN